VAAIVSRPPLVSIVLPTLNGSRYIAGSIASCLGQSYETLELLVVDGGSTDGTPAIAGGFDDPRLRILPQAGNRDRLAGALNVGFAAARGAYYTWTQDDDAFTPQAIEVMVAALEGDTTAGMVYAGHWRIDGAGRVLKEIEPLPPEALLWTNPVGHCFLYRSEVAWQAGEYDPAFTMAEDAHYWMRLYRLSRLVTIAGQYAYHRWHEGSLTVRDYGRYQSLRVAARARREVLGIGWRTYQRQVAAAYVEEAFAAYREGACRRVRRCFLQGVTRDPGWLANRGLLAIGLRCFHRGEG
jgi:glycosyltransferase involved in cell wall biosynthesis